MKKEEIYKVENLTIDSESISFKVDKTEYKFRLSDISPKLAKASEEERRTYKISPSGYGIHWELINEDISISGLIQ